MIWNGSGLKLMRGTPGDQAARHRIVDAAAVEIVLPLFLGFGLVGGRLRARRRPAFVDVRLPRGGGFGFTRHQPQGAGGDPDA